MSVDQPILKDKSFFTRLNDLTLTPYICLANAACILASPLISPAKKLATSAIPQESHRTMLPSSTTRVRGIFNGRRKHVGLTTRNALLFGIANLAGSWMIYDDDIEDGSGFLMAWSTLFLIVNGRSSLTALKYRMVWPLMLSTMAVTNVGLYGRRFITSSFK
ncbi:similar to Saccharomyces cerevisiae YIL087C AIM19 Putative protein of unknown function [Maudiozyma barnettii]|uniref:Altered inheritance of mitochondria protein 19, mitochondrial n=1 Tax=Maudiozyma barnettii TaxID=61262 RepID=A0A8H2VJR9_9SACH|nr:Aim19p [Kazachstania barnettii]CAB4257051.1 similar to Saccharomyces cerevisiae YIL087C AIM19 Putative protein of unknown function [Kazachstania barnettii]CAD1779422.1 similar to Saccharomyces cerevisiae YIL087C AIM19 Putative protein of unknown function [Kazachstania barnettii]